MRDTVLELRSSKGMVVKPEDPDSVSCGSFFTNPVVSYNKSLEFPEDMQRWSMPGSDDIKLSAGWLIENSGIPKGLRIAALKGRDLQQACACDHKPRWCDRQGDC